MCKLHFIRKLSYIQGQYHSKKIREYFYYIDHEGQLFLHDTRIYNFTTCFKDQRFLSFFFRNIRPNETQRYTKQFPFISVCGNELNFISCEDRPIVFTSFDGDTDSWFVNWSNTKSPFIAGDLCMLENGRLYHSSAVGGYGLVRSQVADQLFPLFDFDSNGEPVSFRYKGRTIELNGNVKKLINT
uniref:DUF4915 domain-containing protein n=1 Tax=Rhabditophanes sp. KR3021 TaxID=114890 RepID=A0AC35UDL7_9BILA